jgi:bifunctional oligoribonuclease and PAP phosphatase NrnA
MPLDWQPFVDFVNSHSRFLLMTHIRPDGDALGSELALASALEALGKKVRVVIASKLYDRYDFVAPPGRVERFIAPGDQFTDHDAIIIVDTGTWNQLGDFGPFMQSRQVGKCVIDHHRTQDDLGGLRLVDTSAEACGRLIREAIQALGVKLDATMARALFMALSTDTGWFRHSNVTPETHTLAAELIAAGANPTNLYELLFERSSSGRLKLLGRALERLQFAANGQVAWTEVFLEDYRTTGGVPSDTEDLINYPRGVDGVEVAFLIIEQPEGGTKISFRSRSRVDVSKVAEQFNGGGHRLASGAMVREDLPTTRTRVLQALEDALKIETPT